MAWELPARVPDPDEALVPRSTSKARLLLPELQQMRQTQSMLMSGYAAAAEAGMVAGKAPGKSPDASRTEDAKPQTKRRRAARPKQTAKPARQTTSPEQSPVPAPERPKHESTRSQPAPATSRGWEYSVMLQRAEDAAPPPAAKPGAAPAATNNESSLSSMFERLRSHSKKPPTPPAPVPKAPGFLNKLWAK